MSNDLPPVSSTTDAFLSVLAQRQAATNALLTQILDRLPKPIVVNGPTIELREPQAATQEPTPAPEQVEVEEPAPARTARKRTSKKGA